MTWEYAGRWSRVLRSSSSSSSSSSSLGKRGYSSPVMMKVIARVRSGEHTSR